jgi:DNA-binding HxlR family transcriptional regulator
VFLQPSPRFSLISMKRTSLEHSECAVARSLDVIGDWWSLLILREAFAGHRRFSEIQKNLGVAKNILSARLKKLVVQGILKQVPATDGSSFHEYELTDKGRGLSMVLMALRQWGEAFFCDLDKPCYVFVDKAKGKRIKPLEFRSTDGRKLKAEDVRMVRAK